jgi:integrase/recombinase XerD
LQALRADEPPELRELGEDIKKNVLHFSIVLGGRSDKRFLIDGRNRLDAFVGKRNKLRVIDLRPFEGYEFFTALPAYIGSSFLFWHDDGQRYTSFAPTFNKLMNRVEAKAMETGVEFHRFAFHHLRHRHAVDWLKAGENIYTLQGRLGHTSVKTTEMYLAYLTPEESQVAKFGKAVPPQKQPQQAIGTTLANAI